MNNHAMSLKDERLHAAYRLTAQHLFGGLGDFAFKAFDFGENGAGECDHERGQMYPIR